MIKIRLLLLWLNLSSNIVAKDGTVTNFKIFNQLQLELQLLKLQLIINFYIKKIFTISCNQLQLKLQLVELQLFNYNTIFSSLTIDSLNP